MWVTPMSHLLDEGFYSRPITGCKSRLRTKTYTASHKPNAVGEICCCQLMVSYIRLLDFVSSWGERERTPH